MLSLGCRVDAVDDARVRLPDGTAGRLDPLGLSPFYAGHETDLVSRARAWLGIAYRWGGRSVHGVDCSGLLQRLLAAVGYAAPRDACQQEAWARDTFRAVSRDDVAAGDLLFWGRERATHVGVALDGATFLHAREWVRVGAWDEGDDRDLAALHRGTYRPSRAGA